MNLFYHVDLVMVKEKLGSLFITTNQGCSDIMGSSTYYQKGLCWFSDTNFIQLGFFM